MENKTGKYLKYAIGEIILVVIGILIALSINNWNEKQKLDSKTQEYYVQLKDDLNKDVIFVNQIIEKFENYLKDLETYTNSYYEEDMLTPIEAYKQISILPVLSTSFSFNSSTIETLQNSGDISLIPSNIRNKLIDLKRQQELMILRAKYTNDGKNSIIQNLNPLLGSTTLPNRLNSQPKMKEFLNIDKNLREIILVYEGVHRWKSISEQESINKFKDMLTEIDTIVSLINKELKI
ncbi:DUF6090 family protein [Flavobacteriaceae bacterium S0825]|uniref:DUF6090 family protein n=1 Tax=Gaetbulibacter sp. S0825 TaxID=2720084 RepID=UPI00142FBF74|nr:DUF6090 family protein [Gaetbulibacter sp. S0825]MCK0109240.1 DUF6090 family protein [Flavobacteriaceae bacterium S0825]NIX64875.1 hypothetical protein [Gaetbulibacter sp. S0825]